MARPGEACCEPFEGDIPRCSGDTGKIGEPPRRHPQLSLDITASFLPAVTPGRGPGRPGGQDQLTLSQVWGRIHVASSPDEERARDMTSDREAPPRGVGPKQVELCSEEGTSWRGHQLWSTIRALGDGL